MTIWKLDEKSNSKEAIDYCKKHGFDKGQHKYLKVGDIIEFWTGYNDDIRARASIKGINGDDLYVYNDCYWYPINGTDKNLSIKVVI